MSGTKGVKFYTQDVSGRRVNILERVTSVVLKKKEISRERVCNSEYLQRYSCLNLLIQSHCEW
jgi:hypothetical protein